MKGKNNKAFTLLEVLVALTIMGLSLGALLSLLGGSKRLSWHASEQLAKIREIRPLMGIARLNGLYDFSYEPETGTFLGLKIGAYLPVLPRQTTDLKVALQQYRIINEESKETFEGIRWALRPD